RRLGGAHHPAAPLAEHAEHARGADHAPGGLRHHRRGVAVLPRRRDPAAHAGVGLDDFRGTRLRHERLAGLVLSRARVPAGRARFRRARGLVARHARPEASPALSTRMESGARAIVIVGGGLMGLSAAFHLRRADPQARVTVLERARVGDAASSASAAGVRAMSRDPAERALALESLHRWPELDRELEGTTGYRRGGGLRIALDDTGWAGARATVGEQ